MQPLPASDAPSLVPVRPTRDADGPSGPATRPRRGSRPRRVRLLSLLVAAALGLLAGGPAAASADYRAIYADCPDGTIDGSYTAKELQAALQHLDANMGDYQECSDAIVYAQITLGGAAPGAGGGGRGSGTAARSSGAATSGAGSAAVPAVPSATSPAPEAGTSTAPGTVAATADQDDARGVAPDERAAALAAATASADAKAAAQAAELQRSGVSAASFELGAGETPLPEPVSRTLLACTLAALLAGTVVGLQALRRRRPR